MPTARRSIHLPERSCSDASTKTGGDCQACNDTCGTSTTADKGNEGTELRQETMRTLQGQSIFKLLSFRPSHLQQGNVYRITYDTFRTLDTLYYASLEFADLDALQVVRRKAGKRHRGHLYIICSANPRHKQRQG
ncbi:hypothetical protein HD806DRAFT_534344 [Xylariaceae sp. AK1471]|nr:hypothetical protein HD806DRAFT_534344 [Xylariaceae sp. AK1471]